jgi:TonB-dependent starch-binding outer membrane protein SusC
MKKHINTNSNKIRFIVMLLLLSNSFIAFSQQQIRGKVMEWGSNTTLPGVNVMIKGTVTGTATDMDGNFTLIASPGDILVFSYMGYLTEEVAVGSTTTITVNLMQDIQSLEEFVVVGYGVQKKSDLTGSVASVGTEQIQSMSVSNAAEAIKGRVSGVQISQNDAAPGAGANIRIRGNNSINSSNAPLIVIDGFTGAGNLNAINPRDIKSVEVLKDASATAIYGARGSNGVIIITTFSGAKNTPMTLNYNVSQSIKDTRVRLEMLNGPQYMKLRNDAIGSEFFSQTEIQNAITTDWQDLIFRQGSLQNHQLSLSGGSEKTSYHVSGNFLRDEGVIINSHFERYSIRSRISTVLNDYLSFDNTLYLAHTNSNGTARNTMGYAFDPSVTDGALKFWPHLTVRNENGNYIHMLDQPNPYAVAAERLDRLNRNYAYNYANIDIKPFKGLTLRSTFGITLETTENQQYWPSTIGPVAPEGKANRANNSRNQWSNENIAIYDMSVNKHNFNFTTAFTQEFSRSERFGAMAAGFVSDHLGYHGLGGSQSADQRVLSSGVVQTTLMSYLGRLFYNYDQRYYLTASYRIDGSSQFARNKKWGNFPSVAAAWRVSQESFMQPYTAINDLKLRASWGIAGNMGGLRAYESMVQFSTSASRTAIFNDAPNIGMVLSNFPNPDLGWENTEQLDIGFDFTAFNDRVTLVFDYFHKTTTDMLMTVPLPSGLEVGSFRANVGSLENKGVELSLNTVNVSQQNFNWNTTFIFSTYRNKILELSSLDWFKPERILAGTYSGIMIGEANIVMVGKPLGSFYGYVYDGLFEDNSSYFTDPTIYTYLSNSADREGQIRLKDINGDGKVDANDRVILGNAQPDFIFGFTNEVRFKNFDLTVFTEGVVGSQVYNIQRFITENTNANTNVSAKVLNRWTPDNRDTDIQRAGKFISLGNSHYLEDGSYLKIRDIQLGYNLNPDLTKRFGVQNMRVAISAQNYFVFTNYSGYDPEVNSRGGSSIQQNVDLGSYPTFKSLTLSVNVDI